jgi:two-component system cell cycle sensor histidine kinase/response regulator CckA
MPFDHLKRDPSPKALANPTGEAMLPPLEVREPCVLVAEDEDMVRDLAVRVLRSKGMRVIAARDGREAIALFQGAADEIDAVLLDLTMPVVHGRDVFLELRRLRPSVGIVITSGYTESGGLADDVSDRSVRFLQKPYRAQTLLAGIEAVLPWVASATPAW